MLFILETVDVVAILLMLFMLVVILNQQPSKAQMAFILYNVFTIIFVIGLQLELMYSDTVGEALSGLCVQYVGQAGFLMALLWFVSVFARFSIPAWIYGVQGLCSTLVLVGIFTAEKHPFFYSSMEILTDGLYNRIEVEGGVLWYLHYIQLFTDILAILVLCAVRYRRSSPVQRKRILYIAAGIGALTLELFLKGIGVFGSYNPVVIAMTVTMFCMMMAMLKYRYFGSLHAAVDNAFNHGNEGLIILDGEDMIIFANHRMDELFADIRTNRNIGNYPEITSLMGRKEPLVYRGNTVYELRVEDIIENGEKNGHMLWFINQTQQLHAMQKLKEADEAKTQFLMKVSHELRTPMNTMLGMNEMIIRESAEEDIRNYAREVAGAGAHMMALIDEVLDASRLESGRLVVSRTPYKIEDILEKAEELMRPQAERKELALDVEIAEELKGDRGCQVGDSVRLLQVITNLLSNSIKYTDKGFVGLRAEGRTENGKRQLALTVSDSGIGIPKEELDRIFEIFERGSNIGRKAGIGLGLAIVKQLTEAMGGSLTVESTLGQGSRFTILLPWAEATSEEMSAWREERKEQEQTSEESGQLPDLHTKHILAVDDNERNLMVIKQLLRRTKAVVETAPGGRCALEICRKKKYDLILLDHMMPDLDGIETLHRIREDADGKNRETPVIALTANAGREAEQMYLAEGFAGYLAKPVEPKRLERLLISFLKSDDAGQKTTGEETVADTEQAAEEEASVEGEASAVETAGQEDSWLQILEHAGMNTEDGIRYADADEAFYRRLLELFAGEQEKQKKRLTNVLQQLKEQEKDAQPETEGLWKQWVSACHGMKGEARGIGAAELGEKFYSLELAGREQDIAGVEKEYPDMDSEWQRVVEGIRQALEIVG